MSVNHCHWKRSPRGFKFIMFPQILYAQNRSTLLGKWKKKYTIAVVSLCCNIHFPNKKSGEIKFTLKRLMFAINSQTKQIFFWKRQWTLSKAKPKKIYIIIFDWYCEMDNLFQQLFDCTNYNTTMLCSTRKVFKILKWSTMISAPLRTEILY